MGIRLIRTVAALAAAVLCACGTDHTTPGSGNTGPVDAGSPPPAPPTATQITLELEAAGSGLIRGAGADCRGICHVNYDAGKAVHLQAVPDPDYTFTNAYNLRWDAKRETAYPSTFVIAADGTIKYAVVSKEHGGRSKAADVLKAVPAR